MHIKDIISRHGTDNSHEYYRAIIIRMDLLFVISIAALIIFVLINFLQMLPKTETVMGDPESSSSNIYLLAFEKCPSNSRDFGNIIIPANKKSTIKGKREPFDDNQNLITMKLCAYQNTHKKSLYGFTPEEKVGPVSFLGMTARPSQFRVGDSLNEQWQWLHPYLDTANSPEILGLVSEEDPRGRFYAGFLTDEGSVPQLETIGFRIGDSYDKTKRWVFAKMAPLI